MNNMEEDIKILEDLKKDFISLVSKKDGFVIEKDKRKKQIRAIENIINRNRYLETKAAAEINNEINNIKVEIFKNYIPVSLVEEKIEEYFEDEEWLVEHDLRALCDDEKECREYYTNKKLALKDIKKAILDKLNKLLKNY